jgi:hypothetical protein
MHAGPKASEALAATKARRGEGGVRRLPVWPVVGCVAAFYVVSWRTAQVEPSKLVSGMPKLAHWLAEAWPPDLDDLPLILQRTAETVAMAAVGTTIATVLAIPVAVFGSRNITPMPMLYGPVRWFLNALRGIDSFVFANLRRPHRGPCRRKDQDGRRNGGIRQSGGQRIIWLRRTAANGCDSRHAGHGYRSVKQITSDQASRRRLSGPTGIA